ncbi:tRNA dimethylallyltransferase 2 isoform X2 [Argentina anserina]|uniref:tRNA dimethylallyltransferase 2 isoform X2 n=1 Tax=Argentina anserina TaxID=57926 RepID=UPI00217624DF|nr:tRNA dimethylallyltransferase 2 isoform X2 [Potentilla anserina]
MEEGGAESSRGAAHEKDKEKKPKVVVIMGPTGSGKSKLAIDLASHFPIEVINADSMQVYNGLDVLTNKVPPHHQNGVPHHLLGTVSPNVEFTAKDFRDSAVPLINDILSRNCLPVIVGGTNYYIQALVSPFLFDDAVEDMDEIFLGDHPVGQQQSELAFEVDNSRYSYDDLKVIDPIAANRIHPNDHRKINQYLNMYAQHGVLPSKHFQEMAAKNWGRVDNFRYNCFFLCVDASLPVLDRFVDQRVDSMIDAGLLDEVYDIFTHNADYTRGFRQAIGVREFESFLSFYITEASDEANHLIDTSMSLKPVDLAADKILKENMRVISDSFIDTQPKAVLKEAIEKVKLNTRRLVRRQKRRINRLDTMFGWNIHSLDATESILCKSDATWAAEVVGPAAELIRSFLNQEVALVTNLDTLNSSEINMIQRDLWTRYTCEACGDKILRGAHEWEQHKQGRVHRKRISRLKKGRKYFPEQRSS